jgi:hypothetical protein
MVKGGSRESKLFVDEKMKTGKQKNHGEAPH